MIIQIRDLMSKKIPVEFKEQIDMNKLLASQNQVVKTGLVDVKLQVVSTLDTIHVNGQCAVEAEFICSRCLNHFKEAMEIAVDEVFSQKKEVVEADEEESIHYVPTDKLDLTPYIEENMVLGLPFIPLCKEDCQGLCMICGQNKNEQPCDCKQEKIDPRLAGLKAFFDES